MKNYKTLLLVVLAIIVVAGAFSLWQVGKDAPPPPGVEDIEEDPMIIGENVSFTVTEGEIKKWVMEAERAVYNETQTAAKLEKVHGVFYNAKGEPVLKFQAPHGHYTNQNHAVVLTGGVVAEAVAKEGADDMSRSKLEAPRMEWNVKSERVSADGGVVVDYGKMGKSTAQRANFALDFSTMSLEGQVSSEILY